MALKSPISTLIEMAEKEVDDAAKLLGKAIRAHEDTEKKLSLLQQYRDDYAQRLQDGAAKGLTVSQYTNFLSFLAKLDSAIDGQKQVVMDAEHRIVMARTEWQASEKKRLSYDTLQNRALTVQQKKEAKRDQKQTDEMAARALFYKR
ncbi:flagellar FliJ protein [Undibacterium sp. KW1]|uniref:flagellar export protein FliJ n=1 Tax=Undibacterium sp. KW1 TaxID=2058624 RepID=UPI001331D0D5|nr:flagellar export protein FliJ [Undibacterium sp. KW1]BBB60506.1 flagellar FliJ protein [Undibacterium sp. KW1]